MMLIAFIALGLIAGAGTAAPLVIAILGLWVLASVLTEPKMKGKLVLTRLYLRPTTIEGPTAEKIAKVRAVATDERGDQATRDVATAQLRKWGLTP